MSSKTLRVGSLSWTFDTDGDGEFVRGDWLGSVRCSISIKENDECTRQEFTLSQ